MSTPSPLYVDSDDGAVDEVCKDMLTSHHRASFAPPPPAASAASAAAAVAPSASERRTGLVKQRAAKLAKKFDAMSSQEELSGNSLERLSLDAGSSLEIPRAHNTSADWNAAMEVLKVRRNSAPAIPDLNLVDRGLTQAAPSGLEAQQASQQASQMSQRSKGNGSDCSFDSNSLETLFQAATSVQPKFRHNGLEALREMRRGSVS